MHSEKQTQFDTEAKYHELFLKYLREGIFSKSKVVDVLITPEDYIRANGMSFIWFDPLRVQIGDYQMRLHCSDKPIAPQWMDEAALRQWAAASRRPCAAST